MEIKIFTPKNHAIKALIYWIYGWKQVFDELQKNVLFASAENWLTFSLKNIPYVEIKFLEHFDRFKKIFLKNKSIILKLLWLT